ncbi:MAG: SIMPL domain-containing protein [bacterium]|nr:SIMPL domain-containing protein [bacterium]
MNTQEIQKIYKWVWIVLIILAVFLGIQTLLALKGLRNSDPSYNSISVSGEGEAFAVPDLATFSFTVSADADTVSAAQEEVTKKIDAVVKALTDLGIEEKDIKTTDYSVWPRYSYASMPCSPSYCPPSTQKQDGYTASHNVSVKVRKTEDAGKALAAAGDQGATGMSSISFTVDDPDKITNEAREKAIASAKAKAEILSDQLGVRLVRVVSYSDNSDGGVMPYYREGVGMGGVTVAQDAKAPTIPTGENKVRVVVNVTYEIR